MKKIRWVSQEVSAGLYISPVVVGVISINIFNAATTPHEKIIDSLFPRRPAHFYRLRDIQFNLQFRPG